MKKIFAVALATVLMMFGLVGLGAPASAHTSAVQGVATCQEDGTYRVVWTYTATNVPNGVEAETKAMTSSPAPSVLKPIDGVLKGGQVFLSVWDEHKINVPGAPVKTGNWSASFAQENIPGTATKATTMVQTDWKDGHSEDPVGVVVLPGDCKTPPVEEPPTTVIEPHIQDYLATCDAETREAKFVLDNTGSNVDVTYTVDGVEHIVPAGTAPHVSAGEIPFGGKTYIVTAGDKTWTFTAEPCEPTVMEANPQAELTPACGLVDIFLSNPEDGDDRTTQETASFVVYVDGEFHSAHAVLAGAVEYANVKFPEDSGDHTVSVRTGPAFGDELLAEVTTSSDCTPPVVTPPTEEPTEPPVTEEPSEEPTEPVKAPPATQAPVATPVASAPAQAAPATVAAPKVVRTQAPVAELAHTGVDVSEIGIGVIILLAVGGLLFGASRAGKRRQK